ncbi:hypothetical protein [Streptomyces hoynatensis]|uniref:hypothetical protein n=1 Tax=Streptomyces hoynatensis TaxID=1141874 RepID=UPI00187FCE7A|nr:hypothetical protein [Streptomyces hoynatensis]
MLGTLLFLYAAQLVGAALPHVPLLCAAGAAGLGFDLALRQWRPGALGGLNRVHCDEAVRQLLRDLLTVACLAHLPGLDAAARLALVAGLLACYAAHFACRALGVLVRRSRTLPIVTRNIDTSGLGLSPAPPRLLARPGRRALLFSVPATAGLLGTAAVGDPAAGLAGVGLSLALFAGGACHLATWLLPGKRPPGEERMVEWFLGWLEAYRPEVGLYFSGGQGTAYQANMWLPTLAALGRRPLVVLRERSMVQQVAAVDLPVVCLPRVAHLMLLEQSSLRMLLHPANAPKTSQVLRIPTIKHAFTNHGESDKLSSCNPYAKVYDEVWVAGPAARRRYALAEVGVDDRDVVEVGRPQLAPIRRASGPPPAQGPVTVLYAPTWEGWTSDPGNTSVILAGENLVRALLADRRVRLLYKPHPMTGSVNPLAGAADARIRELIAAAETARADGGGRPGGQAAREAAEAELARRTEALDALTARAWRPGADEMERMGAGGAPEPGHAEAVAEATAAWHEAFWNARPPGAHVVLTGARPELYSCFNQADLLISDVSSVVADFLASGKPYAVVNTSGLAEAEFRAAYPTVRAATLLTPDAAGVPALLASVLDPARDTLAADRAALAEYLLGPAEPPSLTRFRAAVDALCAAAEARRARRPAESGPGLPTPRPEAGSHQVVTLTGPRTEQQPSGSTDGAHSPQGDRNA